MIRTFIQVTALSLVLMSSFFLIRGVVGMGVKNMAELSRMKWGYHSGIAENLTRQKSDMVMGATLLLLSFLLSLANLLWPMRYRDLGVSAKGVIVAIVVSTLIFCLAMKCSGLLQQKWYKEVEHILTRKDS